MKSTENWAGKLAIRDLVVGFSTQQKFKSLTEGIRLYSLASSK